MKSVVFVFVCVLFFFVVLACDYFCGLCRGVVVFFFFFCLFYVKMSSVFLYLCKIKLLISSWKRMR